MRISYSSVPLKRRPVVSALAGAPAHLATVTKLPQSMRCAYRGSLNIPGFRLCNEPSPPSRQSFHVWAMSRYFYRFGSVPQAPTVRGMAMMIHNADSSGGPGEREYVNYFSAHSSVCPL